jgi:hypothetical protein
MPKIFAASSSESELRESESPEETSRGSSDGAALFISGIHKRVKRHNIGAPRKTSRNWRSPDSERGLHVRRGDGDEVTGAGDVERFGGEILETGRPPFWASPRPALWLVWPSKALSLWAESFGPSAWMAQGLGPANEAKSTNKVKSILLFTTSIHFSSIRVQIC